MKKSRRKWIVIAIVLIVIVVAGSLLFGGGAGIQFAQETATTGNLITYYNFSGELSVDRSMLITAPAQTTVSEVYVKPNTYVHKNARLMRLADGTVLKADIAGEITSINVVADNAVNVGDTLAEIMDLESMKATFKVDEYDVPAIEMGKVAEVTIDGSGTTFEAQVTAVDKRATQSGDLSYYNATIDLSGVQLPEHALPGMQITVKVLNQQVENAVLLKMDAVSFTTENKPYVLLPDGSKTKMQDVEVGINDGTYVQIISGINSGDTVLYTPTATNPFMMMGVRRNVQ